MDKYELEDPDYTDKLTDLVLSRHHAQRDRAYRQLHKALVLAPTLEVCEALLRGQDVPRDQLDLDTARRYGL